MPTIKNSLENKIPGSLNKKLQFINWSAIISKIIYKQSFSKVCGIQAKRFFYSKFPMLFNFMDYWLVLRIQWKPHPLILKLYLICIPVHPIYSFPFSISLLLYVLEGNYINLSQCVHLSMFLSLSQVLTNVWRLQYLCHNYAYLEYVVLP